MHACIIGTGRMGRALETTMRAARIDVAGAWSRSSATALESIARGCDTFVVAVPDRAIDDVLEVLASMVHPTPPLVVVTSGSVPLADAARLHRDRLRITRMHPLQVVNIDSNAQVFDGVLAAITAFTEHDRHAVSELCRQLGMDHFNLADEHAPLWHASASLAANALTALLADSITIAQRSGLDEPRARCALVGLARAALDSVERLGARDALTGPAVRGDVDTIRQHRIAIAEHAPEVVDEYDALVARTRALAALDPAPAAPSGPAEVALR